VAGDSKYGGKTRQKPQGLARQFLHAQKLKITLPAGENKAFFAPLAQDLRETLEGLEKNLD